MFRPLSLFNRARMPSAEGGALDPFFRMNDEFNRMFDEAFANFGAMARATDMRSPRIDVHETADRINIEAELPGVSEENLDIQLSENVITIRGEKRAERKEDREGGYRVLERSYGSFARAIPIPFPIEPSQVNADFRDGVLRITLPKPAADKPLTHRIQIGRNGGDKSRGESSNESRNDFRDELRDEPTEQQPS